MTCSAPTHVHTLRRRLAGSSTGGISLTQEMLDFCAAHGIEADVEVIATKQVNEAFERGPGAANVRHRFVIGMATLAGAGTAAG